MHNSGTKKLMKIYVNKTALTMVICAALASGQALSASGKKADDQQDDHREHSSEQKRSGHNHFDSDRRELVENYYKGKKGRAACPPGLAKKGNGCLPPGQAKKWQLGQTLQANTSYQPLPQDLLYLLGQAPAGEHYGMIDEDILLLANVTELVLEVIAGPAQ